MTSSRFIEACMFATRKHGAQRRKAVSRTVVPYVVHTFEAAQILTECGVTDEDVLIAAVLHDTLEDTDTTKDDLSFKFGERVLSIVEEVTDDPSIEREAQKQVQIKAAPTKTYAAKLVKAADKTSNMRDLVRCPPNWSNERIVTYVQHARSVVSALNHGGELPPPLLALFWQASTDILDRVSEHVYREETKAVS